MPVGTTPVAIRELFPRPKFAPTEPCSLALFQFVTERRSKLCGCDGDEFIPANIQISLLNHGKDSNSKKGQWNDDTSTLFGFRSVSSSAPSSTSSPSSSFVSSFPIHFFHTALLGSNCRTNRACGKTVWATRSSHTSRGAVWYAVRMREAGTDACFASCATDVGGMVLVVVKPNWANFCATVAQKYTAARIVAGGTTVWTSLSSRKTAKVASRHSAVDGDVFLVPGAESFNRSKTA
jgi:hypothetical protein